MLRTIIKSRLHSIKHKRVIKQDINNGNSNLPSSLQPFKQKLLSRSGFIVNK